ncbi:MAG: hypothetical protein WC438_02040 [Candidatus Pacearchaeota archaeon]
MEPNTIKNPLEEIAEESVKNLRDGNWLPKRIVIYHSNADNLRILLFALKNQDYIKRNNIPVFVENDFYKQLEGEYSCDVDGLLRLNHRVAS